MADRGRNM